MGVFGRVPALRLAAIGRGAPWGAEEFSYRYQVSERFLVPESARIHLTTRRTWVMLLPSENQLGSGSEGSVEEEGVTTATIDPSCYPADGPASLLSRTTQEARRMSGTRTVGIESRGTALDTFERL